MPGSSRHDPYRNFNFRVEIDGIASSSFSEVVFPDSTIGVVEYREGGDKTSSSRKLPGRRALQQRRPASRRLAVVRSVELVEHACGTAHRIAATA